MPPKQRARKTTGTLAPSIRKAQEEVRWVHFGSWAHAALLAGIGVALVTRENPAWVPAVLCFAGVPLTPLLGRSAWRGNSFSALVLLVSVLAPAGVAWLAGYEMRFPLVLLLLAPAYWIGLRGSIGLRGRRGSRRER